MTTEYGTYRLIFEPAAGLISPSVEMSISGEADLTQMLEFYGSFLRASSYVFDGEVKIVEDPAPQNKETVKLWDDNYTFNPFSFNGSHVAGGGFEDAICFGAAQGVPGNDIITFG